jgi:hypothetical protein
VVTGVGGQSALAMVQSITVLDASSLESALALVLVQLLFDALDPCAGPWAKWVIRK